MEKEKKKRFECYVNYEELQAFYRAQGEISLIFHVSRAVFPSSLLYRDRKIILRSEFQLFEFSFSKGEGGERVRDPQTRAPPLRRALSTTFSPARCLKIFFPSAKIPEDGIRPNVKFLRISTGSFSQNDICDRGKKSSVGRWRKYFSGRRIFVDESRDDSCIIFARKPMTIGSWECVYFLRSGRKSTRKIRADDYYLFHDLSSETETYTRRGI